MKLPTTWQDWSASLSQLVMLFALIPTLLGTNKPELLTSLLTALALSVLSMTFFSLRLVYSGLIASLIALCWYALFFQVLF